MNTILVIPRWNGFKSASSHSLLLCMWDGFSESGEHRFQPPSCSSTCKRAPNILLAWWMSYSDWGANHRCVFLLLIKFDLEVLPRLRRDKLWDLVMRTGSVTVGGVMGVIGVHSPGRSNAWLAYQPRITLGVPFREWERRTYIGQERGCLLLQSIMKVDMGIGWFPSLQWLGETVGVAGIVCRLRRVNHSW